MSERMTYELQVLSDGGDWVNDGTYGESFQSNEKDEVIAAAQGLRRYCADIFGDAEFSVVHRVTGERTLVPPEGAN